MVRTTFAAFGLAALMSASAFAAGVTPSQQDQLRPAAEKSCNEALDHNSFDYGTMDECVDATIQKMARAQAQNAQVAAGNRSAH